jgi:hypothetical protein
VNEENILLMKNWEKFTKKQKQPRKQRGSAWQLIVLNLLDANYLCNRLQVTKSLFSEDIWSVSGREFEHG